MDEKAARARDRSSIAFFALVYLLSWSAWLVVGLSDLVASPEGRLLGILGAFAPSLVGLVLTLALDGWSGVRALLVRLAPSRGGAGWCLAALALPPALVALSLAIDAALHGRPMPLAQLGRIDLLVAPFVSMLVIGGLSEEVGWRGFALPRLRRRHRLLASSLIVGAFWGLWHLPAYTLPGLGSALPLGQFVVFALTTLVVAALFTWLAENSRNNLAVAILFHAALNTAVRWPDVLHLATPDQGQILNALFWLAALLVVFLPRPWGWRPKVAKGTGANGASATA